MSHEFYIFTKQQIDIEFLPPKIHFIQEEAYASLQFNDIEEDGNDFMYVLILCLLNNSIEQMREMHSNTEGYLKIGEWTGHKQDLSSLFEVIDTFKLKDFLIVTVSDFANMPCHDEYHIPIINTLIVKDSICCDIEGYGSEYHDAYKLLEFPSC